MTGLDVQTPAAPVAVHTTELQLGKAPQRHSGRATSLNIRHMEAFLLRVVGRKGADALIARSRQMCGAQAPSSVLSSGLFRLSADLMGEPLAQRMLPPESERGKAFTAN
jgi:hypothetical protein